MTEKQIAFPNIRLFITPIAVLMAGIFCALLFNKRVSYWLIGLFAHSIIYYCPNSYLMLVASLATLENFIFLGSSLETIALFSILFPLGLSARKYLYKDINAVMLLAVAGLLLELFIEYCFHHRAIVWPYTFLKLSVTLVGVWVVSLKSKLFDR